MNSHHNRRRSAAIGVLARAGSATVLSVALLLAGASASVAVEGPAADTNLAAPIGPEILGVPLVTVLWLVTGLLAIIIGLATASRRRRVTAGQAADKGRTVTNGSVTNGSVTNGSVTNGSVTNGSATNGSATNGSATNGSATNGSVTNIGDASIEAGTDS